MQDLLQKVPYIFVVGKREAEEGTVAIRTLGGKNQDIKSRNDAVSMLIDEAKAPFLISLPSITIIYSLYIIGITILSFKFLLESYFGSPGFPGDPASLLDEVS